MVPVLTRSRPTAIKALAFPKEYLLSDLGMLYPHQEWGFQSIDEDDDMADLMGVTEKLNEIMVVT